MVRFEGKVAIVTGAGSESGIGRSVALRLAAEGAAGVVVNYSRNTAAADEVVEEINKLGGDGLAYQADVSSDDQVRAMVDAAIARWGRLDHLVNNAARTTRVRFEDLDGLTDQIWNETFDVNLRGAFYCIRAAAPHLKEAGGAVVNVSSIAALRAVGSSSVAYAAAKAGLINMTQTLARGLGPEIRVNAIVPGFIDGQWLQQGLGDRYEETREKVARKIPLQRITTPEGAADAVCFLLDNAFVTGHALVIDGGYTIRD
jgi:3-oxoacyl-[acyl-carrier protein] reductase